MNESSFEIRPLPAGQGRRELSKQQRGFRYAAGLLCYVLVGLLLIACTGEGEGTAPSPPDGIPQGAVPPPTPSTPRQGTRFDPETFRLVLQRVASGFSQPVFVTHAGDGSGRLFVVERAGTIRIIANGSVLPEPFLDIRSLVRSSGLEQGLLGLAFHPRYRDNGRFFVYYTALNNDNTIAEYRVSADPNRADLGSARILLAIPDFAANHNGGMLAFGPDGYLYAGTGDGGGAGDPMRNGQNLQSLLGKLLRLDIDRGQPYSIPLDNPFVGRQDARAEIWAYGLRNPWRFSFDRVTGDLWIGDVGQNEWEEIDLQPAGSRGGENYGWSIMEGAHCFRPREGCDATGLVAPVVEYSLSGGRCAVTGGYVYRGRAYPALTGVYYFGDYCSGQIWALYRDQSGAWQQVELLDTDLRISSFGEDEAGEIYLVGFADGAIYRLTAAAR